MVDTKETAEKESNEPENCFECSENDTSCRTCNVIEKCSGCSTCGTQQYEYCIHCQINCKHEKTCVFRSQWESQLLKEKVVLTSSIDPCTECKYMHVCLSTGYCPEGTYDTHRIINSSVKVVDMSKKKNKNKKWKNNGSHGNKVWDTGIKCIDECPHKSNGIRLNISLDVYLKLEHLQKEFPYVEFLVYGNAEKKDDIYILNDIIIPKQRVGSASVDDIVCEGHYNTVIHKHPGDDPGGFSRDDEEYANMNHDFSILIGSKGLSKIIGVGRIKTECNKWMRVPLKIDVEVPSIADKFFLDSVTNIEKTSYVQTTVHYPPYNRNNKWDEKRQQEVVDWYKDRGFCQ